MIIDANGNNDQTAQESPAGNPGTAVTDSGWQTVLDIADPIGDDHGPGTYLYPTHRQFAPQQGLLDIERFVVEGTESEMRYRVTFGAVTNPWKGPFGFSHQLMQIYIDHKPGGERRPLYPGANVVFSPKAPWDTLVKVTGWGVYLLRDSSQRPEKPKPYERAKVQVLPDGKTIEVILPMDEWMTLDTLMDSSFYLLVGGQDGFGPDNFRVVKKQVSEWYFGGGDVNGFSPNVIDLVTPPGRSQQKILSSYDPEMEILAVVEPVQRPNPVRTGLVYLISILIGILLWVGWRKRNLFHRTQ